MQRISLTLAVSLALCCAVQADEVEDGLASALKFYKEGKPVDAASSLQKVQKILGEKTGGAVAVALPDQIGGWRGGKVETKSLGATGGGTTTTRTYRQGGKDKDDEKKIIVTIAADSPLLGQISTFLKAPALGRLLGAKPKQVGPYAAMYIGKEGILQFAVDQRYVVVVQGKKLSEDDIVEIAVGVKVETLKNIH
ncbi:MAG: hypothetical protein JWO94_2884 [Verrucomicrobiaceae bacterium]|nr:hypothetical protein [Verrucomicrobiaceae bacterium]